jgi:pilus assembly protein Flp/PilA
MRWIRQFLGSEDGATAVEYAVMLAMIIMTVIGSVATLGSNTAGLWGDIDAELVTNGFGS